MDFEKTPDGRLLIVRWLEIISRRDPQWPISPMLATQAQAEAALEEMRGRFPDAEIAPNYRCFSPSSALDVMEATELQRRILRRGAK